MDIRLVIVVYLMICILPVVPSPYRSRSRNKNASPTYDQKQTGEYNIQLHLKDFEVVALLSDSAFGDLGDYDYNYDYSELTVKPGSSTKPPSKPESSTSTPTTAITTQESIQSTTPQQQSSITIQTTQKTTKIHYEQPSSTEKVTNIPTAAIVSVLPTVKLENELEGNFTKDENLKQSVGQTDSIIKPIENLTIIDKDPISQEEHVPLVIHRKCSNGFTRDKLGRCRRVRRPPPQFSFGISRLASLASKLRQGTNDSQSSEDSLAHEEN